MSHGIRGLAAESRFESEESPLESWNPVKKCDFRQNVVFKCLAICHIQCRQV